MRDAFRQIVPSPIWGRASEWYWFWRNRGRHRAAALLDRRYARSQRALAGLADRHRGERCFVIGNGPSLRRTDLSRLDGEITFGMNRIYLMFDELGFGTSYYVSVNELVIEQCAEDIARLQMPKFLTWRARRWLPRDGSAIFVDSDFTGPETFSPRATGRMFEGSTVTYVALQLAYHMGFGQAILIGVDHNFSAKGEANAVVESQGDDPDHFSPQYFGKGFRWQLPDLEASERAYRMAKQAYQAGGRQILDATVGGKLDVFPKADYESLF